VERGDAPPLKDVMEYLLEEMADSSHTGKQGLE